MATRNASAQWLGTLKGGKGTMKYGTYEGLYTYSSRFEEGEGTNPEELVGAAIAGCFSMFLSALLSQQDIEAERIDTTAKVTLDKDDQGPLITNIDLDCKAKIDGVDESTFSELSEKAKKGCPISRLYQGTEISLKAELL